MPYHAVVVPSPAPYEEVDVGVCAQAPLLGKHVPLQPLPGFNLLVWQNGPVERIEEATCMALRLIQSDQVPLLVGRCPKQPKSLCHCPCRTGLAALAHVFVLACHLVLRPRRKAAHIQLRRPRLFINARREGGQKRMKTGGWRLTGRGVGGMAKLVAQDGPV